MGLVETGVGLLPGGGGCKEMTLRALDAAASVREGGRSESVELLEALRRNFETVAMAKVSTSAVEARRLGYSVARRPHHHEPRAAADAMPSDLAREMAHAGYAAPLPRTDIPAPGENLLATLKLGVHMMRAGRIHQRPRREGGQLGGPRAVRRQRHAGHAGQRAVSAGSGAGGVPLALRREEDAGADCLHVEDRQAAEELRAKVWPRHSFGGPRDWEKDP